MPAPSDKSVADTAQKAVRRLARRARRGVGPDAPGPVETATTPTEPEAELAAVEAVTSEAVPSEPVDGEAARRGLRQSRLQWRVAQAVHGRDAVPKSHEGFELEGAELSDLVATAKRARAMSTFGDLLATGHDLRAAHVATVRELCATGQRPAARAFVVGTAGLPDGELLTAVGNGLALHSMAEYDLAWRELSTVDVDVLAELLPVEAITCALVEGSDAALGVALDLAARGTSYDLTTLVELAGRMLVTGHTDAARELIEEAGRRPLDEAGARETEALHSLRRWTHPEPVEEPPAGAVRIGVMDYHQPDFDRASRNVGDYVQTLAMLGNLARFRDTRFVGADGLGDLMTELQGRVRPGRRLPGGDAEVHLTPISRDFSAGDPVPEDTWMIGFGWHMHSTFRLGFGLPYHPHLNPVFVSFHLNRVNALTPEAIAYLREHGPVGCRDWTTVDTLLSAGVDAFFTGCLTTTVSTVFPEDVEREDPGVVGAVDLPPAAVHNIKGPVEVATHAGTEFREASLVEGTRAAIGLLEHYQRRFTRVVTSRLHSYLPATSLGLKARFRPPIAGDVRFDGLLGMAPQKPEFTRMRDGLMELLREVHELVLAGTPREEVYARWRELTAPRVAEARARFAEPAPAQPLGYDLAATVRDLRAGAHAFGPHDRLPDDGVTDVAMSLDQRLVDQLPVTVDSMLAHASGPVRLWVTARGLDAHDRDRFHRLFPELPVTFLDFDGVEHGEITRMLGHISVATMDRLLLPEVLPELDRLTYLDIDTVTLGDVCELAATDLRGHPLAARPGRQTGATLWRLAGDRIEPELASELRRTMSARHAFDFWAANAGVLVLDLARMRADSFVERFVPMAARYGLNDQDILNAYTGPDRVDLDPRWNALPLLERVDDAAVVHYAGVGKPWGAEMVPAGEKWRTHAERVAARLEGMAP